jgi:hypothetical protein
VHYTNLSKATIEKLTAQSEELGMQALLAVNKSALEGSASDTDQGVEPHRMTFGIYFYSEPSLPEQPQTEPSKESENDASS